MRKHVLAITLVAVHSFALTFLCNYNKFLSAGCSTPQAPVNGSVSEFTSSKVGAQVTYHCDTGLVLVGEMVASCSSPSLQWMPSAADVMCIQNAGILHILCATILECII